MAEGAIGMGVLDDAGVLSSARQVPSPNCDDRPQAEGDLRSRDAALSLLVVHNISLPPGQFGGLEIEQLFTNTLDCSLHPFFETLRGLRVSSHFLIRRGGELLQFVPCSRRAWHAGVSSWLGRERCNDFSIGVELEGADDTAFTDAQYAALNELVAVLRTRYPLADIAGHSDVAPGRKTDPGPCFDWRRVRA